MFICHAQRISNCLAELVRMFLLRVFPRTLCLVSIFTFDVNGGMRLCFGSHKNTRLYLVFCSLLCSACDVYVFVECTLSSVHSICDLLSAHWAAHVSHEKK